MHPIEPNTPSPFISQGKHAVSLTPCHDYDETHLIDSLERCLSAFSGLGTLIRPGDRVMLKLNLLFPAPPEAGVTTHPAFALAMARLVLDHGGIPFFADSGSVRDFSKLAAVTGIGAMAESIGVPLINLDERPSVNAGSQLFPALELSSAMAEADHIIGLTKLKTHTQMHLTCALKHYFGLIPGDRKQEWHFKVGADYMAFARLLAEIWSLARPTLSIVDGIVAMEGDGPGLGGSPRPLGVILAGQNAPALDTVAAWLIGAKPEHLYTQIASAERGLGPTCIEDVYVHGGEHLEQHRAKDWKFPDTAPIMIGPALLRPIIRKHFTVHPEIDAKKCVLCLNCLKGCPAKSISRKDQSLSIDLETCIRCFCCVEVCPEGAMRSKTPLARKLAAPLLGSRLGKAKDACPGKTIAHQSRSKGLSFSDKLGYGYHLSRANLQRGYRIPLSVYLFLTYRCTLECLYCNVRNEGDQPPEMDTQTILNLIDEMSGCGVKKIQFTGGEPLLRNDIGQLLGRAKQAGMFVGVSSNGDLVPQRIKDLEQADVVFISLDGPPEVHDRFRGQGSFERALKACKMLKRHGIPVWTTTVVNALSAENLDFPIQLARENGWLANFQVLHSRRERHDSCFNSEHDAQQILLDNEGTRLALDHIIQAKKNGAPIGHSLHFLQMLRSWEDYSRTIINSKRHTCWAGKLYAYIEPDGRMFPCGTKVHRGSPVNVVDMGFKNAWEQMDISYSCSLCLSGCQMEQNMMFSLDPSVIWNWYRQLAR